MAIIKQDKLWGIPVTPRFKELITAKQSVQAKHDNDIIKLLGNLSEGARQWVIDELIGVSENDDL